MPERCYLSGMSARAVAVAHPVFYSFREYVRIEEESGIKHEYLAGQIYAMAGGTPQHSAIATAIAGDLRAALRGGRCSVYGSDLRVRVRKTGLGTYPDVSVVCGSHELDPENKNTVTNPILIVEVASKSTEKYDRGEKFEHYKQIRSLQEYVLVSRRERAIEVWRRTRSGWTSYVARAGEQAKLSSVGVTLDVDAIYQAANPAAHALERARRPRSGDHRRSSRKGSARRRSR
jgi:Uma2 family endonuclease